MEIIHTKSQFDKPYNNITSQCSWFCIEVVNSLPMLLSALNNRNTIKYQQLIELCLNNATENRRIYHKYDLGENIDQVIGSENYNYYVCKSTISINDFKKIIPEVTVLERNYPVISENKLKDIIVNILPIDKYFIVNKHGESFVVAFVNDNQYIIIDSHKSKHQIYNSDQVIKYIIDDYNGFYYILVGILKSNINTELENYVDVLITNLNTNITTSYSVKKKFLPSNIDMFINNELDNIIPSFIEVSNNNHIISYEQIFNNNVTNIKIKYF